jgi:glucan biosynthesis protein C
MSNSSQIHRYHSLDGLRAIMMLLGLVLHSAASYTTVSLGTAWPYQDQQTSPLFDILVFFIHLFRMPTFFVVAGFFGAFLFYRRGPRNMVTNRLMRVALPLVFAWAILFPLSKAGFVLAQLGGVPAFTKAVNYIASGMFLENLTLIHLWFLYDLLMFYAVALLTMPLIRRMPKAFRQRLEGIFSGLVSNVWGPLVFSLLTMLTLYPMPFPGLESSTSFTPPLRILMAYGVFFTVGWLLYNRRDVIGAFGHHSWRHTVFGAGISCVYLYLIVNRPFTHPLCAHLAGIGTASVATWLLLFGITGLFIRYLKQPSPLGRYLADASYWLYLVHLPLTIWIPGLLANLAIHATVKFLIVLSGTTCVTLFTYHYLVRSTAIGLLLNGRRSPRSLPRYDSPALVPQTES